MFLLALHGDCSAYGIECYRNSRAVEATAENFRTAAVLLFNDPASPAEPPSSRDQSVQEGHALKPICPLYLSSPGACNWNDAQGY